MIQTGIYHTYPTFQKKMAPSDPPLQKSSSWNGCHERHEASFLWPRKVCSSWSRRRMSKSLIKWSLDAVISHWPFLFHLASMTVLLWACLRKRIIPLGERRNLRQKWKKIITMWPEIGRIWDPIIWLAVGYPCCRIRLDPCADASRRIWRRLRDLDTKDESIFSFKRDPSFEMCWLRVRTTKRLICSIIGSLV